MFTSEQLTEGSVYTREYLRRKFNIKDATINTGIFQPSGYQSVWLFITENKSKDSTQYKDQLHEDTLDWDGQTKGRNDQLIINHEAEGLELLVFYRTNKRAFSHGGFIYEGQFRYESHTGSRPTHFTLQRVTGKLITTINGMEASESEGVHEEDKSYSYLTNQHEQVFQSW